MKLTLLVAALACALVACSGSSAGVEAFERTPDGPTTFVTPAPEDAVVEDAGVEEDSSTPPPDSGTPDSGVTPDAGDPPDSGSVVPRFGLSFHDVPGERAVADLPAAYIAGGQTQATWEGWFKHDGFKPDTPDLNGRLFAHGGENVYCQVVTPAPVATEAGKVECGVMQEHYIRSTIKVTGFGWFHLALTYDSGTFRLFINGSPQGSYTSSKTTLPPELTNKFDTNAYGKLFFGATSADKYSTTVTVDEFRLSPVMLYGQNAFTPPKHLTSPGADILLLLDDGSGAYADGNKVRIYSASWVQVAR